MLPLCHSGPYELFKHYDYLNVSKEVWISKCPCNMHNTVVMIFVQILQILSVSALIKLKQYIYLNETRGFRGGRRGGLKKVRVSLMNKTERHYKLL